MKLKLAFILASLVAASTTVYLRAQQTQPSEGDVEILPESTTAPSTAPSLTPATAPNTPTTPGRNGNNGGRNGRNGNNNGGNGGGRTRSGTLGGSSRTLVTDAALPPDYQVLVQKSMFARDRRPLIEPSSAADTRPAANATATIVEHFPILLGTGESSGEDNPGVNALFEMLDGTHEVLPLGATLDGPQGGTLTEIITDGDEKSVAITHKDGSVHHVKIGQDLAGRDPDNLPTSTLGSTPATPVTTAPSTSTAPASTGPGPVPAGSGRLPNESVEDYMKRKRREEGSR